MDMNSLGLLILRVGFGAIMALNHGLPKLLNFSNKLHTFLDPLGVGSPISLSLTISAELLCATAVVFGLFTRLAAIPLMITMGVAFFIVHSADPFTDKEHALMFLIGFSTIFACGPGQYSADAVFRGVK